MRPSVIFLFITDLFITYMMWQVLFLFNRLLPCSLLVKYTSYTRGGKSYFYSILLCSLLVKYTSYTGRQVLFLFNTALFITCRIHILYRAASPISIQYCSIHYLSNTRLIQGGKSYFYSILLCSLLIKYTSYTGRQVLFLFNTALFITCRIFRIQYRLCSLLVKYTSYTHLIQGGKSYFYSILLYSLRIKYTSYTGRQVLFLFNTALFITCQIHVLYRAASPISMQYCSIHYLLNTHLIQGGKSYFYSILLCSLLVKYTSYMRRQVLFLFNTALFITC